MLLAASSKLRSVAKQWRVWRRGQFSTPIALGSSAGSHVVECANGMKDGCAQEIGILEFYPTEARPVELGVVQICTRKLCSREVAAKKISFGVNFACFDASSPFSPHWVRNS